MMDGSDKTTPELARGAETHQVQLGGLQITYHEAGQANAAHAPVVLIHGSTGSTERHFGFLFPMLATQHRVISIDLANPVSPGEPLELEHLEAQVLAVLDAACPGQPVTLLGFSLGGVVAAFTAARHGPRIANLILLSAWAKTDTYMTMFNRTWRALRAAKAPELGDFMGFAAYGAPFMATKSFADVEKMRSGSPLTDFADAQMELNARIDITELVARISAPTLIIACSHDQMVPVHHARALFGMIEDARYVEVPAGHAVTAERPAEVLRLVDRFAADPQEYPAGANISAIAP